MVEKLSMELATMERELNHTQVAFMDTTRELKAVTAQFKATQKQVFSVDKLYKSAITNCNSLEEVVDIVEEENFDVSQDLASVEKNLSTITDGSAIIVDENGTFCFKTKFGHKQYLPAIRKLYYSLLADQIPPSKIEPIIKRVLKSFLPNLNVENLQLPKGRCAGYMRSDELTTVSLAHKASVINEKASKGILHLNTDGTTLQQRKLRGIAIEGVSGKRG